MMQYKMYFLFPYNISAMQCVAQGIHASKDYFVKFHNTEDFKKWSAQDTVVLLDGGTTNDDFGTLNATHRVLLDAKIDVGSFREPDLQNALTAICFIADERVFFKGNYSYEPVGMATREPSSLSDSELAEVGGYENAVKRFVTRFKPVRRP